jgi:hypothetical protein
MDEHWETTGGDVVELWQAEDGQWRWHVQAPNHEVVEQGEGYVRRIDAVDAALRHHPRIDVAE